MTRFFRLPVVLLQLSLLLMLSACAVQQAMNAFADGRYIESVQKVVSYLDGRNAPPDEDDAAKLFGIVRDVVGHYETQLAQTLPGDRDGRIANLDALWQLRKMLDGKPYDAQVAFFTGRYSIDGLAQQIAAEYYQRAAEIQIRYKDDYLARAQAYGQALQYYPYRDAAQRMADSTHEYWRATAEEHYQRGKVAIAAGDYRDASEALAQAIDAYARYGPYKDAQVLYDQYDRRYRSDESRRLYSEASAAADRALRRYEFRAAAELFQQAHDIYAKYGTINDAQSRAARYRERGMITVWLDARDGVVAQEVRRELDLPYVRWVSGSADLRLSVQRREHYSEKRKDRRVTAMSENVKSRAQRLTADGGTEWYDVYTTYRFNKVIETSANELEMQLDVEAGGLYRYRQRRVERIGSHLAEIHYTGQVPPNYRRHSEGQWLSRYQLADRAWSRLRPQLQYDLDEIAVALQRL